MDADTRADIIDATGRALCAHGYADLTMQRIADESSMTSAAIHYHFDTKAGLLEAFLDDLLDRFEAQLACEATDPRERLATFVDAVFSPSESRADDFPVALMELKAQAPYDDRFRERFRALDDAMRQVVADAIRDGSVSGYFADTDPDAVARVVVTVINGAHVRTVALDEDADATRTVVVDILRERLDWTPESEVPA